MGEPNIRRIVILGKTGAGKSSLANTILGDEVFKASDSPNSETKQCQSKTKSVNGRSISVIDTPGFFETDPLAEDLDPVVSCMTECSPGPHAFLIVLKVDKYTEQEKAVISVILQYFSDRALKFATVVFTHGDQLRRGMKIEEFVSQNEALSELVKKCGGRCHVIDNKYWNNQQQDGYRSNQFQIEELLKTIDKTVEENKGEHYTNELLTGVEEHIEEEEERIRLLPGDMSQEDIREQAKRNTLKKLITKLVGTVTGVVLGALLGVGVMVTVMINAVRVLFSGPVALGVVGAAAVVGGAVGGWRGYKLADEADTPMEAAKLAKNEVMDYLNKIKDLLNIKTKQKY